MMRDQLLPDQIHNFAHNNEWLIRNLIFIGRFGDALNQAVAGDTVVKMPKLDLLIGSGGVLSHAPRRSQAMMMLMDAFEPQGVTRLAVDSIFMMPHLGVTAEVNEEAATQVFDHDCLVELGTCVAPLNKVKRGKKCFEYTIVIDGKTRTGEIMANQLVLEPLPVGATAKVTVAPIRSVDMGAGEGKPIEAEVHGGVVGVVFDGRGRPIDVPVEERRALLAQWVSALEAYPPDREGN